MSREITDERLRNTRAWAQARVGSMSGAEVIVAAIDETLAAREARETKVEKLPAGNYIVDNTGELWHVEQAVNNQEACNAIAHARVSGAVEATFSELPAPGVERVMAKVRRVKAKIVLPPQPWELDKEAQRS